MVEADEIRSRVEKHYNARSELYIHALIFVIINAVLWALWAFLNGPGGLFPFPVVVMAGWGSGLAAHALEVRSKSPRFLASLDRAAVKQLNDLYGDDWQTTADSADIQRVHETIHKRARQTSELNIHGAVYAIINLLMWFIWSIVNDGGLFPFPLIIMGFWGAGLAAHAATVYFDPSRSLDARERAVQEALAAEEVIVKKKKRSVPSEMILTDDGEQLEVVEDDWGREGRLQDEKQHRTL